MACINFIHRKTLRELRMFTVYNVPLGSYGGVMMNFFHECGTSTLEHIMLTLSSLGDNYIRIDHHFVKGAKIEVVKNII